MVKMSMDQCLKESIKIVPKEIIKNPSINDVSRVFQEVRSLLIDKREWYIFQGISEGFNRLILLYTSNYFTDAIKFYIFEQGKQRNILALARKNEVFLSYWINKLGYPEDIMSNCFLIDFTEAKGKKVKTDIHNSINPEDIQKFLFNLEKQTLIMLDLISSGNLKVLSKEGLLKIEKK